MKCLFTKEEFTPNRANQKFINNNARISYHNEIARKKRLTKAFIDKALDKNRNIILNLLGGKNEIIISKDYLLGAGFDFEKCTHQQTIQDIIYTGIYEFGYSKNNNGTIKIIKIIG